MAPPDAPHSLPRVLLIDDDPISREVLAMLLEMRGFSVDSAEDGDQALDFLQDSPVDAILMDTQMPGLSGVALVQALRAASAARIIAISGSDVSAELRAETDGFLRKPVEPEELANLLASGGLAQDRAADATFSESPEGESGIEAGHGSVIDPVILGKLKAMMPATAVEEIYRAVATDLNTRLAGLQAAMDAGSAAEVVRIAHTIKGGCSMVGLTPATEAAARLETSNLPETWPKELLQLHFARARLESILGQGLLW